MFTAVPLPFSPQLPIPENAGSHVRCNRRTGPLLRIPISERKLQGVYPEPSGPLSPPGGSLIREKQASPHHHLCADYKISYSFVKREIFQTEPEPWKKLDKSRKILYNFYVLCKQFALFFERATDTGGMFFHGMQSSEQ